MSLVPARILRQDWIAPRQEQTMGDEEAIAPGEIHRQYYGKDKPITGQEDTDDFGALTLGADFLGTIPEPTVSGPVSDYMTAGLLEQAKMAEGKVIPSGDKNALENELIKEGIEIQKRIAKSKGWFSNVYKGIKDKEGRKIDKARHGEILEQLPYAKYYTGDEMDDPEAIMKAEPGGNVSGGDNIFDVSDTTTAAAAGQGGKLTKEQIGYRRIYRPWVYYERSSA